MSGMQRITLPVVLLLSALALSACATKPEAVPAPAPIAVAAEPAPAPVAEQAAPAPAVTAEVPAPKPVVKKAGKHRKAMKKIAKPAPPEAMKAAPVAAPEPAVKQEAPAVAPQPPAAPIAMSTPVQPVEETGFLENYWGWLLGIVIAVAALLWLLMGKKKE